MFNSHSSHRRARPGFGSRRNYGKFSSGNRPGNGRGFSRRGPQRSSIRPDQYVAKAVAAEETKIHVEDRFFAEYDLDARLQHNIARQKFAHPTHIQDQAIPYILEGRDVLAQAATGSGKTGAFLIPMISKALRDRNQKCLIILPTRELANQVEQEFLKFANQSHLRVALVIGGTSMGKQRFLLSKQPQFVIGTPGRLKDMFQQGVLRLEQFNNVVLDEVDRMLDMGFVHDIKFLISKMREDKQSLFFSATMEKDAERIADQLLKEPVHVKIASRPTSQNVEQGIVRVTSSQSKLDVLHGLLVQEEFEKVLVFSKTKRNADIVSKALQAKGHRVEAIHGDKPQRQRERIILNFRSNRINILVATDVVARGLDVPNITHVINYDEPMTFDDYIHRIGRTGRIGKPGKALTFIG